MNVQIYSSVQDGVDLSLKDSFVSSLPNKLEPILLEFLSGCGCIPNSTDDVEISLVFVTPGEIAEVNEKHRDTEGATDVLSFPMWEDENGNFVPQDDWPVLPLGDIIVCPAEVDKNARDNEKTFEEELVLVIFHGFLHLIGRDHDTEEREKSMWQEQDRLTAQFFMKEKTYHE